MFDTIIIGPTKVGKTALIASLQQAATLVSLDSPEVEMDILAKNDLTRKIFNKAFDVIQHGEVPFAGTSVAEAYDFTMNVEVATSGISGFFAKLLNNNRHEGHFQFLDSPGGAVFDDGATSTTQARSSNPHFQAIVQLMLEAEGLIVCVNACDSTTTDAARQQEIRTFYTKAFQFLLTHGFETSVPIQRVCFVLTKSDLWADKAGHGESAVSFLEQQDPVEVVRRVIGEKSLDTLSVFLEDQAEVAFAFTSVYGFFEGGVHQGIGRGLASELSIDIEDWKPYNIAESFAWLISGQVFNNALRVLTHKQLSNLLKGVN